jgi:hypothetical protein
VYPTTLDEWDDLPDELPWDGEVLEITATARQLGADWILPASFYRNMPAFFRLSD